MGPYMVLDSMKSTKKPKSINNTPLITKAHPALFLNVSINLIFIKIGYSGKNGKSFHNKMA